LKTFRKENAKIDAIISQPNLRFIIELITDATKADKEKQHNDTAEKGVDEKLLKYEFHSALAL